MTPGGRRLTLRIALLAGAVSVASPHAVGWVGGLEPEFTLTDSVSASATGDQRWVSSAHDPTSGVSLVVWRDERRLGWPQVFGTRVDSAGQVLDPEGILFTDGKLAASAPSVVFDGTHFLVVFDADGDIWGRRMGADGTLVDPSPFAISNHGSMQRTPFASSNGGTTLVVWEDLRNAPLTKTDVYGARVVGAVVLEGADTGTALWSGANHDLVPRAAWGDGQWLVVWNEGWPGIDSTDVSGVRVSGATGGPLSPGRIVISSATQDQRQAWPASNGVDFFVVWQDGRDTTALPDIRGARVASSTGAVLDPDGIPICSQVSDQSLPSVALASGAGHYQVVWQDGRPGLYGNRVDAATGVVADGAAGFDLASGDLTLAFIHVPRVFPAGTQYFLGWQQSSADTLADDVRGSRLTTAAALLDAPGIDLARSGNGQTEVAVAGGADTYLTVWSDERGAERAIYAARVDGATGESLDGAGILLSAGGLSESSPAVAYNGTAYLVAWSDRRWPPGIWGTRVTASGEVLDPGGIPLATGMNSHLRPSEPAISSNGSGEWFLVWRGFTGGIYGARVEATGAVLDPDGLLISDHLSSWPRVAFGDGHYLVLWRDDGAGTGQGELYGARVSATGVVREPAGILIAPAPGWLSPFGYGVAYSRPNFVVAYAKDSGLYRTRIGSATGTIVDTAMLAGSGLPASLTHDGEITLIAYAALSGAGPGRDLKVTRLSPAGVDLDPTDWDVAGAGDVTPHVPGLATLSGSMGRSLVAYSRYDPTAGITSDRVRARRWTTPDVLFADGFESSDLSAWSSAETDDGDLAADVGAAMDGTVTGLGAVVDDAAGLFVTDDTPENEERYRARFYFDANGFDPGEAQGHRRTRIFVAFEESPTRRLAAVVLRRLNGAYAVMGRARLDDGSHADTGFVPISDGPHVVEIHWRRATSPDEEDGLFEIWVDGIPAGSLSGLDNHLSAVDFVRLGALSVKAGASGTLLFDEMESRRWSYIGP